MPKGGGDLLGPQPLDAADFVGRIVAQAAGDFRAGTTSPSTFDRAYDPTLDPASSANQRMAAITQLFYTDNFLHDWYYDAGFDEPSGNAQNDNYGRGGSAGDRIFAEAQDYAGGRRLIRSRSSMWSCASRSSSRTCPRSPSWISIP